jgi:hypothetical protein
MKGMNLGPHELRREIDETLAELDELQAEVLELFDELLGEDAAGRLAAYIEAQKAQPRLKPLMPEGSSVPSTEPPETR